MSLFQNGLFMVQHIIAKSLKPLLNKPIIRKLKPFIRVSKTNQFAINIKSLHFATWNTYFARAFLAYFKIDQTLKIFTNHVNTTLWQKFHFCPFSWHFQSCFFYRSFFYLSNKLVREYTLRANRNYENWIQVKKVFYGISSSCHHWLQVATFFLPSSYKNFSTYYILVNIEWGVFFQMVTKMLIKGY